MPASSTTEDAPASESARLIRYRFYASCVRRLRIAFSEDCGDDGDALHLIRSFKLSTFFPNIHTLAIDLSRSDDNSGDLGGFIECLALQHLDIHLGYPLSPAVDCIVASLNDAIQRQTGLQYFGFQMNSRVRKVQDDLEVGLSRLISALPNLETMKLEGGGSIGSSAWEAARWLIGLKELDFRYPHIDLTNADMPATATPFPRLAKVKVTRVTAQSLNKLLLSLNPEALSEIELRAVNGGDAQADVVGGPPPLFITFRQFRSLCSLRFDLGQTTNTCPWEDVSNLLVCTQLTEVDLCMSSLYVIVTDEGLSRMAQAWPLLRSLRLALPYVMQDLGPPALTLRGLEALGQNCPSLERLAVSVDFRGVGKDLPQHRMVGVRDLDLGWSFADTGVDDIASFITRMWPCLDGTPQTQHLFDFQNGGQYDRWRSVNMILADAPLRQ